LDLFALVWQRSITRYLVAELHFCAIGPSNWHAGAPACSTRISALGNFYNQFIKELTMSTHILFKTTRIAHGLLLAIALLAGGSGMAQEAQTNCDLRIASGPNGKVYELMVHDIQSVCSSTISVCSVPSSGGLQNLNMLSANEAELGIVQVDTLKEMSNGDENIRNLQSVLPLHANLLHIITSSEGSMVGTSSIKGLRIPGTGSLVVIRKFSELKGVSIAAVGSAQLMGQSLERQMGYGMKFVVADNDDQALSLLKAGQVQAIFTLGGWPLPTVARLKTANGVQLVDFDLEPRSPYLVVKRNYQNLDAFNFNFLGVPNLLVSRPFKVGGTLSNKVVALQSCIKHHLDDLQEGRYQPIWKEIKDTSANYGVATILTSAKLSKK
jgi:TRAP-type uncharacterized transport system substrate-binding protein